LNVIDGVFKVHLFIKKLSWKLVKFFIRVKFPHVPQISTTDLANWLKKNDVKKPLLLDARTPEEYAVSHLKNARLLPLDLEKFDKDVPIVVYCSVGYRSAIALQQIQAQGYQNVFNLEGSIFQWSNERRPLYQKEKRCDRVHPYNRFWGYLLFAEDN
jgi:rhodanese-related sulfurtransferase